VGSNLEWALFRGQAGWWRVLLSLASPESGEARGGRIDQEHLLIAGAEAPGHRRTEAALPLDREIEWRAPAARSSGASATDRASVRP